MKKIKKMIGIMIAGVLCFSTVSAYAEEPKDVLFGIDGKSESTREVDLARHFGELDAGEYKLLVEVWPQRLSDCKQKAILEFTMEQGTARMNRLREAV